MNEISAEEAAKLFIACCRDLAPDFFPDDPYQVNWTDPKAFPKDIVAGEFLDYLKLYSELCGHGLQSEQHNTMSLNDEQRDELANVAPDITGEELAKLSATERKVFDVFAEDSTLLNKEIGKILGMSEKTVKSHFREIFDKLRIKEGRGRRRELASKSYTTSKR